METCDYKTDDEQCTAVWDTRMREVLKKESRKTKKTMQKNRKREKL